jgi:hypothetical protein
MKVLTTLGAKSWNTRRLGTKKRRPTLLARYDDFLMG